MTEAERILSDTTRKDAMSKLALILANYMDEMGMFKSCYNCEHWLEGPPYDRLQICGKHKMRPPTRIIVSGCDDHSDNLPF